MVAHGGGGKIINIGSIQAAGVNGLGLFLFDPSVRPGTPRFPVSQPPRAAGEVYWRAGYVLVCGSLGLPVRLFQMRNVK